MSNLTLANTLWPQAASSNLTRNIVLAVAGSLFVAAAAQIVIPTQPVPFTLQTFAVLAVGAAYGARLGAATLGLYAILGSFLPFFQGGKSGWLDSNLAYALPTSTMGYIIGFIAAAWLAGRIVEGNFGNAFTRTLAATCAGAVVLYVPGILWLAQWASITGNIPEGKTAISIALDWGFYPFLVWDGLKALLAGLLVPAAGSLFNRKA
jgi:biotin transport system substrate-specific component